MKVKIIKHLKPKTIIDKFADRCRVNPVKGCWLWIGSMSRKRYGNFYVRGKIIAAHRFSFLYFNGQIPNGMMIMHECDTRHCVNPEHLSYGTNDENVADRIKKGRCAAAGLQPFSRTEDEFLMNYEIPGVRDAIYDGHSDEHIAYQFYVPVTEIANVRNGKTWECF